MKPEENTPEQEPVEAEKAAKPEATTRAQPDDFSDELAAHILSEVAGGRSLKNVLDTDAGMPTRKTFYLWIARNDDFKQQYEIALTDRADALFDEITDIADDAGNDWMERNDPDNPGYDLNGEHIQRAKLRVDARKWAASKLRPKKYGDHVDVTSGGERIGAEISPEQAAQLVRARADRSDTA